MHANAMPASRSRATRAESADLGGLLQGMPTLITGNAHLDGQAACPSMAARTQHPPRRVSHRTSRYALVCNASASTGRTGCKRRQARFPLYDKSGLTIAAVANGTRSAHKNLRTRRPLFGRSARCRPTCDRQASRPVAHHLADMCRRSVVGSQLLRKPSRRWRPGSASLHNRADFVDPLAVGSAPYILAGRDDRAAMHADHARGVRLVVVHHEAALV
jgi:hypothetical protein